MGCVLWPSQFNHSQTWGAILNYSLIKDIVNMTHALKFILYSTIIWQLVLHYFFYVLCVISSSLSFCPWPCLQAWFCNFVSVAVVVSNMTLNSAVVSFSCFIIFSFWSVLTLLHYHFYSLWSLSFILWAFLFSEKSCFQVILGVFSRVILIKFSCFFPYIPLINITITLISGVYV